MAQSNSHGRALEYVIVNALYSHLKGKGILLTPRAAISQKRDYDKFNTLLPTEKEEYLMYSELVFEWLNGKFSILKASNIVIDRIPDNEAMVGDVTDISITIDGIVVNLSVKHNHFALKHNRPPSLAIQCGFPKNSDEDISFRKSLDVINSEFHVKRKILASDKNTFNHIKQLDINFIDDNLYKPTCETVVRFINKNNTSIFLAKSLFVFLVGNKNFYKIIASNKSIEIKEFADIPLPEKVEAKLVGKSYVNLVFSNGWIINMRLHSAATLISNTPSLKFDTQAAKMDIPEAVMISK